MRRILAGLVTLLTLIAAPAWADLYFNPEGYWVVGRDGNDCFAAYAPGAPGTDLWVAVAGTAQAVGITSATPMRRGAAGVVLVDGAIFSFVPQYQKNGKGLEFDDPDGRILAALKTGRKVTVTVDAQPVLDASLEGTGAGGALDAARACAQGEPGWWGGGLGEKAVPPPRLNKESAWALARGAGLGVCEAWATSDEKNYLVLNAVLGQIRVGADPARPVSRPRSGWFSADSMTMTFAVLADGKSLLAETPLDGAGLAALRAAKSLEVGVDNRVVTGLKVEGSGLPALLDDLVSCSRGQSGWWGDGAAGVARLEKEKR